MVEQTLERDRDYEQEFEKAVTIIKQYEDFILTTHVNPDGDGLGSESALCLALLSLGKKVTIVNANPTPDLYYFLPERERVLVEVPHTTKHEVAIFLECPDEKRSGGVIVLPGGATHVINIDHHVFNTRYGTVNLIDPVAAAAGEQVWDLICALGCQRNNRMAIGIYTAIATDTGHFKYAGVTPQTHKIIAQLLELGVQPGYMNEQLYERVPAEGLHLLARGLSQVQYNAQRKVGWFAITQDMLTQTGAKANQTENFVNYVRAVEGVEVAVFFLETSDGRIKVSLRSRGAVDVSTIAHQFGGGGHRRAAGALLSGSMMTVQSAVLREVESRVTSKG
ncbi:bifunctional oligoribonuclease/PAP phosphatase NrnA [candidate division FCPU426 bacterium]|nr:bifunctional oligoribonuclease/PAP phosphatase NrnA [candidate division FCPU426 bacterium]